MSDAATLGIAGLAATTLTGIGQAWLSNRRHSAQLRHEEALRDTAELREVLDDGAQTVRRAVWAVESLVGLLRAGDVKGLRRASTEAHRLAQDAALVSGRIALRLGHDHEVYLRYDEAIDAYIELNRQLGSALPRGMGRLVPFRRTRVANRLESRIEDQETQFRGARHAFIAAAERRVGARLMP